MKMKPIEINIHMNNGNWYRTVMDGVTSVEEIRKIIFSQPEFMFLIHGADYPAIVNTNAISSIEVLSNEIQ